MVMVSNQDSNGDYPYLYQALSLSEGKAVYWGTIIPPPPKKKGCLVMAMQTSWNMVTSLFPFRRPFCLKLDSDTVAGGMSTLQWHLPNRQVIQCHWQQTYVLQILMVPVDKSQALEGCRPYYVVQALIKPCSKSQALKACWPWHLVQALIEISPKSQTLKVSWPCHILQALNQTCSKSQALKSWWPCHIVQVLIKIITKSQALKASRPCHILQALIET